MRAWRVAHRRGVRIPVVWNHSRDARDQIGEVTDLLVVGATLHARFWAADPADLRKLGVTVNEASVEVAEPWVDGAGRHYDIMLTHLGVVNLPVIAGQRPFKRLRLIRTGEREMHHNDARRPDLAEIEERDDPEAASTEVTDLVDTINRLLTSVNPSLALANDTTFENLIERLDALSETVGSESETADDDVESPELVRMRLELDRVQREREEERDRLLGLRRESFEEKLDQLIRQGKIAPSRRTAILEVGRPASYSLSLLVPFADVPAGAVTPLRRLARTGADPEAPRVLRRKTMSATRAKRVAQSFREDH